MNKCAECGTEFPDNDMLYDDKLDCWLCRVCFMGELTSKNEKGALGIITRTAGRMGYQAAQKAAKMMFDRTLNDQIKKGIRPKPADTPLQCSEGTERIEAP